MLTSSTSKIPKSLASDAAAVTINHKTLRQKLNYLTKAEPYCGRRMEGYRSSLDQLRQVDTQLADQFERVSVQLEYLAFSSESGQWTVKT